MAGSSVSLAPEAFRYVVVIVPEGADMDTYVPETYIGNPIAPNKYCRGWNPKRLHYCRAIAGFMTTHPGTGRCKYHGGTTDDLTHGRYARLQHPRLRELIEEFKRDPDLLNMEDDVALVRALAVHFIERYEENTEAMLAWHRSFEAQRLELPEDRIMDFERIVTEWEIKQAEGGVELTDRQKAEIAGARAFIDLLRGRAARANDGRPRKVLDIADAHRVLDTCSKIIERIEKARAENAISRPELIRLTQAMGGVVLKHITDPEILKKIREGWLDLAAPRPTHR